MKFSVRTVLLRLVFAGLGLAGCQRETTPPLIEVESVSPRELEVGEHLAIGGVGFPEGKVAHVSFRGELARPGEPPLRDVEIDVVGLVASGTLVDLPINEATLKLFVGAGDHAAHTTFAGEISVAFAGLSPGAPPVEGILHDTWVDVRPPTPHRAVAEVQAAEGARTLAFVGIKVDPVPLASGGLLVEAVDPSSRAEAARLLPADVITEFDGVRVLSTRDLVPAAGARSAWLKIRRGGDPHEALAELPLVGLKPPPAAAMLGPALILWITALGLLVAFGRTPAWVGRLEDRIAQDWLTRRRAARSAGYRPILRLLVPRETGARWAIVFAGALLLVFRVAGSVADVDLDVGILVVVAQIALASVAFLTGGSAPRSAGRFASLRAAARTLTLAVPVASAVAARTLANGTFRLDDLVRSQGGAPWCWAAFESPLALGLLGVFFVCEVIQTNDRRGPLPEAASDVANPGQAGSRVFAFAERAKVLVMTAVMTALFLGGWQLPGRATEQVEAHGLWILVGTLVFALKTGALYGGIVAARRVFPWIPASHLVSFSFGRLIPLAVFFGLSSILWTAVSPGPDAVTLVSAILLSVTLAAAVHVARRVSPAFRLVAPPRLDPFV